MRVRSFVLTIGIGVLFAGCTAKRVTGVACAGDGDCAIAGLAGSCEPTGYCSYPDPACDGGRYSPGAGDGLSNTCVNGPAACGTKGTTCCPGDLCGDDLACVGSTETGGATCSCGERDEPCCRSLDACAANLACADDGACRCGAIGTPCCGGQTCDANLTCTAGTCTGTILQVAVGAGHICALRGDHTVSCWGFDWKSFPQVTPALSASVIASETPYTIPNLTDVAEIRAAERHTCARKTDGTLWCFGHNEGGQLGDGTKTNSPIPHQVVGLSNVSLFDGGRHHTCAVGTVGTRTTLWCWGQNSTGGRNNSPAQDLGRLGNNDIVDSAVPVAVDMSVAAGGGQSVKSLSVGSYHSCVAMSDNRVWCWGRNSGGALGNGTTTNSKVPVPVTLTGITIPAGVTIDEVSCSDGNSAGTTCLRLSNGKVHCWGSGTRGELGDTLLVSRSAPAAEVVAAATFVEISSAAQVHCGRTSTGEVWCWGRNKNGMLGIDDGADTSQPTPQPAIGLTGAMQLDTSHRTACAIDGMNRLFCWGNNRRGQVTAATSPLVRLLVPTEVPL